MDVSQLASEGTDLPSDFFAGLDENPILPQSIVTIPNTAYGPLAPGEVYSPVAPDIGAAPSYGSGAGAIPINSPGSPSAPGASLWSSILGFTGLAAQTVQAVSKTTATQKAGSQRPAATTAKTPISSTMIIGGGLLLLGVIIFVGRR